MDLWVLMDRSRSAQDLVDSGELEWRTLLERSRPGESHRLHLLDYASEVIPLGAGENAIYSGNRDRTRTALALQEALARMDPGRHNRLLVFSDGYSTEPLSDVAAKLIAAGVPLDYRLVRSPETTDYRVASWKCRSGSNSANPTSSRSASSGSGWESAAGGFPWHQPPLSGRSRDRGRHRPLPFFPTGPSSPVDTPIRSRSPRRMTPSPATIAANAGSRSSRVPE